MNMTEEAFDPTTFTKIRERLFFAAVVEKAKGAALMSSEHFSVDGTHRGTKAAGRLRALARHARNAIDAA